MTHLECCILRKFFSIVIRVYQPTDKLKTVPIKIFWIKANIVDQRRHKEEKKVKGQSFFEVLFSEHTCGTKLWEFWRKISIFSETDVYDWMMWESPSWSLETSVSNGLNWNQMLNVTCFICLLYPYILYEYSIFHVYT